MDALPDIIYLASRWRFSLSVVASIGLALVLSNAFAPFTAGYCISLVLLGTGFGLLWANRASAGLKITDPVPPTPISKPVAFLSFCVIGFFWGGVASYVFRSEFESAISLFAAVFLVGLWYRLVLRRQVSIWYLVFAAASLLSGYGALLALQHANAL